jgi:endonuclease YncB( thermonuclease family)
MRTKRIETTSRRVLDVDASESGQTCIAADGSERRCGQKAALALSDWIGAHAEARVLIEAWRRDYNESRPRMALGNVPPGEYVSSSPTGLPEVDS